VVYLASLARSSRPAVACCLDRAARIFGFPDHRVCPWAELRYSHLQALRAALGEKYAPNTANLTLAGVRGVLRCAYRLGLVDHEEYTRAMQVQALRGSRLPRGRALTAGELRALFGACDLGRPFGARTAALLALLYGCGLRRAEAVALDLVDLELGLERPTVRIEKGKGNKGRLVYPPAGTIVALEAWIAHRGNVPGPLLLATADRGRRIDLPWRRLGDESVLVSLRELAELAGVRSFSPHDLRRTFVGDLLDAGLDISAVQGLVGHAQIATTARYDRRGDRARARAADLLHVPFAPADPPELPDEPA